MKTHLQTKLPRKTIDISPQETNDLSQTLEPRRLTMEISETSKLMGLVINSDNEKALQFLERKMESDKEKGDTAEH